MFNLGREEYPTLGWTRQTRQASEAAPGLLKCTVNMSYLVTLEEMVINSTGSNLKELAETRPRDAYAHIYYLFADQFVQARDDDWAIGSPEEDGERAYNGLMKYMEENRAPDPDIEEIDIVINVWKRASFLEKLKGRPYDIEETVRFRVGPQNLAAI